jgi:hypothetical protein
VLPAGHYRLRLTSGPVAGVADAAGNLLDGDVNATAGGAFVRTFFVAEGAAGDFDNDGEVDDRDIDLLMEARNAGANDPQFDLTGDGLVNQADVDYLVETILGTHYGDANLDSIVNAADVAILASNFGWSGGPAWARGNSNGDDNVDLEDLAKLQANMGAGGAPSPIVSPVASSPAAVVVRNVTGSTPAADGGPRTGDGQRDVPISSRRSDALGAARNRRALAIDALMASDVDTIRSRRIRRASLAANNDATAGVVHSITERR